MKRFLVTALVGLMLPLAAQADLMDSAKQLFGGDKKEQPADDATKAPDDAAVYFISPQDGDELESPVTVQFGLRNMGVAPAGTQRDNTGHHHLLINEPDVDYSKPLPSSDQVVHFGGGQTETSIKLPAGEHKLQLLLGDFKHQPHNPPVKSETITITVK